MTDWLMVIITTIYVIATIIICISNYKSSNLSSKANEINMICKIVELEQSRLVETKKAIDNFVNCASLGDQVIENEQANARIIAIEESFQLFQRCILADKDTEKIEYLRIINCGQCFFEKSIEICKWLNKEYDGSESERDVSKKLQKVMEVQTHFFEAKEQYILSREEKLSKAVLGDLSLFEVRNMYYKEGSDYKGNITKGKNECKIHSKCSDK